jgi:aromatic ring-cleaving dioxygenase
VYFDAATVEAATALVQQIAERFELPIGRLHARPIGPHPMGSCQITFGAADFDRFMPWLDGARNGLTVLVHGLTGDDWADHTDHAAWLGDAQALNLAIFQQSGANPVSG